MRNGILTNEEKARAVLCRTGRPGNECACLEEAELDELAAVYDDCLAPEANLKSRVDAFWAARYQRLAAAKGTDETTDRNLFRHRVLALSPVVATMPPDASAASAAETPPSTEP